MPGAKKKYFALIGDLVDSRSLDPKERQRVQKKFSATLEQVNTEFKDEIKALFLITTGDETQGLLHRSDRIYDIVRKIQIDLWPIEIVFGIGQGELSTEIGEYAVGADGPAFHRAREALQQAKEERRAYGKAIVREVRFYSQDDERDQIVNALFLALAVIKEGWTAKQTKVLSLLEQGKNQKEASEILDMPLSHISRIIEASHFREFDLLVNSLLIVLIKWL